MASCLQHLICKYIVTSSHDKCHFSSSSPSAHHPGHTTKAIYKKQIEKGTTIKSKERNLHYYFVKKENLLLLSVQLQVLVSTVGGGGTEQEESVETDADTAGARAGGSARGGGAGGLGGRVAGL